MCDLSTEETAAVWTVTIQTARRSHRCDACQCEITPRQGYRRTKVLYDGRWATEKACAECSEALQRSQHATSLGPGLKMRFGSLFTGIGGLDLGLERAGFECAYQVEIDDFCRKVLTEHWPAVPKFGDIREIKELPKTDLIAGGFPCQDLSFAGKGAGITGERSGLWKEFARIVATCKPKYVLVENVPALRHRGMEVVLQDLANLGYDAVWDCIPASDFGAPFERKRLYIIAFPAGKLGAQRFRNEQKHDWKRSLFSSGDKRSPKADRDRWLQTEPNLGGVADGIPDRVDRVKALGNAVVPCAGEFFGRVITNLEKQT